MFSGNERMSTVAMQQEWDELEQRLMAVSQIIGEQEKISLNPDVPEVESHMALDRLGIAQSRKAYLLQQQSEVENWLVENQAPGWTST